MRMALSIHLEPVNLMSDDISRRDAILQLGALAATATIAGKGSSITRIIQAQAGDIIVGGQPVDIAVTTISAETVRITLLPASGSVPAVGALANDVFDEFGRRVARSNQAARLQRVTSGSMTVRYTAGPPTIHVENRNAPLQKFTLNQTSTEVLFTLGKGPLLGLGEGGPQFDRKGSTDPMRNGQGGFRLETHGTRAPVQWMIGTADGWAVFIHQPYGAFDFTGSEGKFTPGQNSTAPLDIFVVNSNDPPTIMREYARITGLPEMPPMWAFGYQQSSRTLAGPEEILGVARTFREKKLPCDALIYLGTEFAPSGWNTRNGEFTWHPGNFPDPKGMLDKLHADNFKVIVHIVVEGRRLLGTVNDPCTAPPIPPGRDGTQWPPERQVSCYWPAHKPLVDAGVDGWWPDQGDGFDGPSRLNRHRMYWEGSQMYRPNVRPFALHRNASAGAQRYGGFIWSGDVRAFWETLATHVSVAVNTGLSGLPYWGTDIGGFNPTPEYTGELHTRWFQFGAFCGSFRAHGRNWHVKLPWGWDGGDGGPFESGAFRFPPNELANKEVEPILRKYLELRYRLLPYLQTAVREAHESGMPLMRALWLHYPNDATAVARGDEYLWGRDILVAPVVQKGAASRKVWLPAGSWIDFWNEQRLAGGREIDRPVDLATMPLFVRGGAVIPTGPVRQHMGEVVEGPTFLTIYPGADGISTLYEDDGATFDYKRGAFMKMEMRWRDSAQTLTLSLVGGSRMLQRQREFELRIAGSNTARRVVFQGRTISVSL